MSICVCGFKVVGKKGNVRIIQIDYTLFCEADRMFFLTDLGHG
jgi:hypothetical protein